MKKALASAVIGSFFVPLFANGFSMDYLLKAYKLNSTQFRKRKTSVAVAMFFNLVLFGSAISFLIAIKLGRI